jgi:hypothetical protein
LLHLSIGPLAHPTSFPLAHTEFDDAPNSLQDAGHRQSLREDSFWNVTEGSAIRPAFLSTLVLKKNFAAYGVTRSWMQLLL